MVITSKTSTKAVSLVVKEQPKDPAKYYTTAYGQEFRPEPGRSQHRKGNSFCENPRLARANHRVLTLAQNDLVTVQVLRKDSGDSRNQSCELISSVPPKKVLSPTLPLKKNTIILQREEEDSEPSPVAGAPMININIRNMNINAPGLTWDRTARCPWNVGSVISSIPRHDRSAAFQKLFGRSSRRQAESQLDYYSSKTGMELVMGGHTSAGRRARLVSRKRRAGTNTSTANSSNTTARLFHVRHDESPQFIAGKKL